MPSPADYLTERDRALHAALSVAAIDGVVSASRRAMGEPVGMTPGQVRSALERLESAGAVAYRHSGRNGDWEVLELPPPPAVPPRQTRGMPIVAASRAAASPLLRALVEAMAEADLPCVPDWPAHLGMAAARLRALGEAALIGQRFDSPARRAEAIIDLGARELAACFAQVPRHRGEWAVRGGLTRLLSTAGIESLKRLVDQEKDGALWAQLPSI